MNGRRARDNFDSQYHRFRYRFTYFVIFSIILQLDFSCGVERPRDSATSCSQLGDSADRHILCGYNTDGCISYKFICDSILDCNDGSDESDASCRRGLACDAEPRPVCLHNGKCRSVTASATRLAHHECDCIAPFTGANCSEISTTVSYPITDSTRALTTDIPSTAVRKTAPVPSKTDSTASLSTIEKGGPFTTLSTTTKWSTTEQGHYKTDEQIIITSTTPSQKTNSPPTDKNNRPTPPPPDIRNTIILVVVFSLIILIPVAVFIHCRMKRRNPFLNPAPKAKSDDKEALESDFETASTIKTQEEDTKSSKPSHQRNISISSIKLKENSTLLGNELPLDVNMNMPRQPVPPDIRVTCAPGVTTDNSQPGSSFGNTEHYLPDTQMWTPGDGSEEPPYFVTTKGPIPVSLV